MNIVKRVRTRQFYRFTKPKNSSYPTMIDLFSKRPDDLNLRFDNGLTPINIDESIISLSAILLSADYYELLLKGKQNVDGYSIIEIGILILFKIKAWLDRKERKETGRKIDTKNIKKHKNDIFRLLANVSPASRTETSEEIHNNIIKHTFLVS